MLWDGMSQRKRSRECAIGIWTEDRPSTIAVMLAVKEIDGSMRRGAGMAKFLDGAGAQRPEFRHGAQIDGKPCDEFERLC